MSYITWELDVEDGLDAYDPLGRIVILGDEGKVEEESTYLDAFFEALIEGTQRIEIGKTITVDPLVEPNDIIFQLTSGKLTISYCSFAATILDKVKFSDDLRQAIDKLVNELDGLTFQKGQEKRKLAKLRNYLNQQIN